MNETIELNEWQLFSQMGPSSSVSVSELDMLGRCEFDQNNRWDLIIIPEPLHIIATQFINENKTNWQEESMLSNFDIPSYILSTKQEIALEIITNHKNRSIAKPLHMIIQGTSGTGKSYLIACIRNALKSEIPEQGNQLLTLTLTLFKFCLNLSILFHKV
jgi:DNA replication protein DnaC